MKKKLNIGCGKDVREDCINLDKNMIGYPNIVYSDIENMSLPFSDIEFKVIYANHVLEHIKPWLFIDVMNECWRVMAHGGVMYISTPIPGSWLWWQDPTHYNGIGEMTFKYFDPKTEYYDLYKPNPWCFVEVKREVLKTLTGEHCVPGECYEFIITKMSMREALEWQKTR